MKPTGQTFDRMPELKQVLADEEIHEKKLIDILDEERLHYAGDMVLGMNDALVELTGALAGYTFAMQNTKIIAMAGLITGISATMSMTASGYLSSREEGSKSSQILPLHRVCLLDHRCFADSPLSYIARRELLSGTGHLPYYRHFHHCRL